VDFKVFLRKHIDGPWCFKSHYRVDPLLELHSLKDAMDGSLRNVDFSNHKLGKTFVVFLTTNSLIKDVDICSLTNWRSVLSSLLSMKFSFKAIVYICNQIFFNNLVITLQEEDFMDNISMDYEFY
jgi:hypothetical protein